MRVVLTFLFCLTFVSRSTFGVVADVSFFGILKNQRFVQKNTLAPYLEEDSESDDFGGPFFVQVFVDGTGENLITNVTVTSPSDSTVSFQANAEGSDSAEFTDSFYHKNEFDELYGVGDYEITIQTVNDGSNTITLTFPPDDYPNPPRISNLSAAQSVNAGNDFTLTWDEFSGGQASDVIQVQIDDDFGDELFHSGSPGEPGSLTGESTSIVIPAQTLQAGRRYVARIFFARVVDTDTTYESGAATGVAAYIMNTSFEIVTVAASDNESPMLEDVFPSQTFAARNSVVTFGFSEPMQIITPGASISWGPTVIPAKFDYEWSADGKTLFCIYDEDLPANAVVTWTLNPSGQTGFRDLANNVLPELGGSFFTSSESPALDVAAGFVYKSRAFHQTGATPTAENEYYFATFIQLTGVATVKSAILEVPGGATTQVPLEHGGREMEFEAGYASQEDMDIFFGSGTYTLSLETAHDGSVDIPLSLIGAGPSYPNAPTVINLNLLTGLNHTQPITINWQAFTGGTTSDYIVLLIDNEYHEIYSTPAPGEGGGLNGTATSHIIPANTLSPGREYEIVIQFIKAVGVDTTSYPGAFFGAAYISETQFSISTGGQPLKPELEVVSPGVNPFHFVVNGDKVWPYQIDTSTDLVNWIPVLAVLSSPAGTLDYFDQDSVFFQRRFYRVREGNSSQFVQYMSLQGQVVSTSDSSPIAGAVVSTSLNAKTATTRADGTFFLEIGLPSMGGGNAYTVTVSKPGFQTFSSTTNWGDTARGLEISLNPNGP